MCILNLSVFVTEGIWESESSLNGLKCILNTTCFFSSFLESVENELVRTPSEEFFLKGFPNRHPHPNRVECLIYVIFVIL